MIDKIKEMGLASRPDDSTYYTGDYEMNVTDNELLVVWFTDDGSYEEVKVDLTGLVKEGTVQQAIENE